MKYFSFLFITSVALTVGLKASLCVSKNSNGKRISGISELEKIVGGSCTKFTNQGGERCTENKVDDTGECDTNADGICEIENYRFVDQLGRDDSCDGEGDGCEDAPDGACDRVYFGDCVQMSTYCDLELYPDQPTEVGTRDKKQPSS